MRWLSPIPVVVVMLLGVWVTGGLITDEFKLAMLLTAAWMALLGLACLAVAIRRRRLRVPVLGAYVLAAGALGAYLGLSTLADKVVHERVATATARQAAPRAQHGPSDGPRNVLLAKGSFQSGEHESHGRATTIRLANGDRVLTLTDFETSPGPDLRLYMVAGPSGDESEVEDYVDLGGLKGNKGDQQYTLPSDLDLRKYRTVVVWCRAFSVLFARAPLERA
jgi:hypothetical protein